MRIMVLVALLVCSVADAKPKSPDAELRALTEAKMKAMDGLGEGLDTWFAKGGGGDGIWWSTDQAAESSMNLGDVTRHKLGSFVARVQPDGQSALLSYTMYVKEHVSNDPGAEYNETNWRVTEVAKKTADGWRVITAFWSIGMDNKEVNAAAKAGTSGTLAAVGSGGDPTLIDAFKKLTTGPLDAAAATRKDLVAFGSGPGERKAGGAVLARAWQASWANQLKVDSIRASAAGSGTLGYVIANVTRTKGGYTIPFRVFFAFERATATDPWSLVHTHMVVPGPK